MIIELKPKKISNRILCFLEKRSLIRTYKPTKKVLKVKKTENGAIDEIYRSSKKFGPHKLICVAKNEFNINLTSHPENEEVILINNTKDIYKPLYLIVGLHKKDVFEAKAKKGILTNKDIIAIELEYNIQTSIFTVLKDIPHCEVTVPGRKHCPIFFVIEPTNMKMDYVNIYDYKIYLR